MDAILTLGTLVLAFVAVAVLTYAITEKRWRWRWQEVEVGRDPAHAHDTGVFREPGTVPRYLVRAPGLVRMAAFSCLFFGQMFIPGVAMGLVGLVAGGVGITSIPGLITAWKLYGAGLALLRRDPRESWRKARAAAQWALWLNGVLLVASAFTIVVAGFSHKLIGAGGGPSGLVVLVGLTDVYVLFSIAQALLLLLALRRHEDALLLPSHDALLARPATATR